jgi:hypothetical protein
MRWETFLSKRLAVAIGGIVTAIQSGGSPAEIALSVTVIVCTYIASESFRPSGELNGDS